MQQRRLRLGDILDDYCPRERRVTNHVVVAMIDDQVKQTRCSTCDADHEYKEARVPAPRRRKDAGVLATDGGDDVSRVRLRDSLPEPVVEPDLTEAAADAAALDLAPEPQPQEEPAVSAEPDDDGPVHRRLIRATFPRPEGQAPERREPDFTIRQPGGRGPREPDGNRPQGQKRRRPHRGGGRPGDTRFGGSPQGSNPRGNHGNRGGHSGHGPAGGQQPGGPRGNSRPGGENRFRRRRGR